MSELGSIAIGSFPEFEPRSGSMGKPSPGFDITVTDEQGNVLPQGEEGCVAIRCKPKRPVGLFEGYLD